MNVLDRVLHQVADEPLRIRAIAEIVGAGYSSTSGSLRALWRGGIFGRRKDERGRLEYWSKQAPLFDD